VITQYEENEANSEKGFYIIDISADKKQKPRIEFVPLKSSRRFFLREIEAGASLRNRIEEELDSILAGGFEKLPLVKIKITGRTSDVVEQELKEVERKYAGRLLLRISKALESPELESKVEFLRSVREQKLSVEEMGLQLLKKNLDELKFAGGFDCERMFGILVDGNVDNAFNVLTGEQKTLGGITKNNR
jgi:DNA repair exonuclease SbcCD nuclease subunit